MTMDKVSRRNRELAELWVASMSLGAIALLSGLLHCCILGVNAHQDAPLCAQIAVVLAQPVGNHQMASLPAAPTLRALASPLGEPLSARDLATAERRYLCLHNASAGRNAMMLGAMRIDDDVGLNDLNATYVI